MKNTFSLLLYPSYIFLLIVENKSVKTILNVKKSNFAQPSDYQRIAIVPVLHDKSVCFIVQNRLFYNAKQALLQNHNISIVFYMNYFNKTKENFLPFHHNQDRNKTK